MVVRPNIANAERSQKTEARGFGHPGEAVAKGATVAVAMAPEAKRLSQKTAVVMALAAGVTVANLYYNQPLLTQMGQTFGVGHKAGYIPAFTFVGLVLGMLLFVPLGDMFERRRLISGMCVLAACSAAAVAMAPNFVWLAIASLALGMASIMQHLTLPFAAELTPAGERGKAIGIVFTGILLGTLLARTLSGFIGGEFGWRMMYWIAAALMLALALAVSSAFPKWQSVANISYPRLLRSLLTIAQGQPALRRLALIGAMLFGALNAFWVNSLFLVEMPPYHYGERAAGLLGLVGAVGAIAAPMIGRRSDRRGARFGLTIGLITALVGFIDLWLFRRVLWLLIAGVVLLDAGVQTGQVSNQSRIYDLQPGAPSRVNTIYMTAYFCGGALGAAAGAYGWNAMHWDGVCIVGIGLLVLALGIHSHGEGDFVSSVKVATD